MSLSKMILLLCMASVFLRAEWDNSDKQNLSTIRGDVEDIKDDIRANVFDSFSRFNNVTMMGSDGYGVMNPWLLQMAYGVELRPAHVGGSNEHWNLNPNVPTDDYLTAFGLKSGYEDNTQNYLDYIRQFNTYKNSYPNGYYENGNDTMIDNWLAFSYGMDMMNKLDEATFDPNGQITTQSGYIYDRVQNSVWEADNIARHVRARLIGIANESIGGYTGDVLQFNFSWLHGMLTNITNTISNNHWTFNAPWMLNNSYVFTLRPQQGNLLYPLYHAWNEKRSYIDIFVSFVCYFSVFAFITSRIYAILTK